MHALMSATCEKTWGKFPKCQPLWFYLLGVRLHLTREATGPTTAVSGSGDSSSTAPRGTAGLCRHPELTKILRDHLAQFGTAPDGRVGLEPTTGGL